MSPHAFPRRPLVAVIGALLLATAGQALATSREIPVEPAKTLLVFGDPSHVDHAGDLVPRASAIVDGATISSADIERFADPAAGAIAVVAARDLVTLAARPALMNLFERGVPVFVCVDDGSRADVAHVFGIAPAEATPCMSARATAKWPCSAIAPPARTGRPSGRAGSRPR